jgi:membrane protease subunit HflC
VENRTAVFERFNQTLIRSAKGNRADGDEKARGIRASAERERVILIAEAQKKAQGIKGRGDAIAMETTNNAFKVDPDFYEFYRSLESYKETIQENTTLYLSADHPYFKHLTPIKKHNKRD